MNVEMFTDLLNSYLFLRSLACREYQLREARCDETELDEPIDAFARFQAIGIEPEVLFCVSEGGFNLPPLPIVFDDLWDFI